jgi:hypothetical protein
LSAWRRVQPTVFESGGVLGRRFKPRPTRSTLFEQRRGFGRLDLTFRTGGIHFAP